MRVGILVLAVMLMINVIGLADQASIFDLSSLRPDARKAYERLLHASMFSIGPAGIGATISDSELALRRLLNEDKAIAIFKDLLENATTLEGRMYALLGLYLRDVDAYKREVARYKAQRAEAGIVSVQSGCIVMPESEEAVITKIEFGQVNLFFVHTLKNCLRAAPILYMWKF